MSQLTLFEAPESSLPESKWIGYKGPNGRNGAWENAAMPGLHICHCGHPTALRPYYIPERRDLGTFTTLAHAKIRLMEAYLGKV